ncbi:MAG: type II secretion system F family protein [archaeon]
MSSIFSKDSYAYKLAPFFLPIARKMFFLRPSLEAELIQLEEEIPCDIYIASRFVSALVTTLFVSISLFLIFLILRMPLSAFLPILIFGSFILFSWSFFQGLYYPRLLLNVKEREINKDLLFAFSHFLIELRSGIPIYDAIALTGAADYGEVSKLFQKIQKKIDLGYSMDEALEEAARISPSLNFRRFVWQISNAVKVGADVAQTLQDILSNFVAEEKSNILRFGREFSLYALLYLMFVVIFPSLGISIFLIIGSLVSLKLDWVFLLTILSFLIAFQYFFVKFIKMKRPVVRFI